MTPSGPDARHKTDLVGQRGNSAARLTVLMSGGNPRTGREFEFAAQATRTMKDRCTSPPDGRPIITVLGKLLRRHSSFGQFSFPGIMEIPDQTRENNQGILP